MKVVHRQSRISGISFTISRKTKYPKLLIKHIPSGKAIIDFAEESVPFPEEVIEAFEDHCERLAWNVPEEEITPEHLNCIRAFEVRLESIETPSKTVLGVKGGSSLDAFLQGLEKKRNREIISVSKLIPGVEYVTIKRGHIRYLKVRHKPSGKDIWESPHPVKKIRLIRQAMDQFLLVQGIDWTKPEDELQITEKQYQNLVVAFQKIVQ